VRETAAIRKTTCKASSWLGLSRFRWRTYAAAAAKAGFDDAFIYQELARPHAQRKIPMTQIMRDEALAAIREWEEKPDKIGY